MSKVMDSLVPDERYPLRMRGELAAEFLGVTVRMLKDLRRLRVVPYTKLGGVCIYDRRDLEKVLAKYRVPAFGIE